MALEDQMKEAPKQERLTDDEEDDLRIGVALVENLIDDGGKEIVAQALNESNDPGVVIGQFLMQAVAQMSENMPEGVELSKRIYLSKGGLVEQVSDYLQEEYDVPREVMDRAEIYIATQAQSMAQGGAQQAAGGAPQAQPQAAPEQAPAAPMPQPGGTI